MKKLLVIIAGGVGYVLGTKAGRERYEQIRGQFNKVKDDPRVQEKAQQATDLAKEKAPVVKDKVAQAASGAAQKAKEAGPSGSSTPDPSIGDDKLNPESLHFQDKTGPQGDLP
ncbi:MAG: YtxH protein [Marmoricola sp.]|nr:YtxH protein [Marmoricola sp.]